MHATLPAKLPQRLAPAMIIYTLDMNNRTRRTICEMPTLFFDHFPAGGAKAYCTVPYRLLVFTWNMAYLYETGQ